MCPNQATFKIIRVFNCGVILTHRNCICILVLTTLKMATQVAKTCWRLLYNYTNSYMDVHLLVVLKFSA